MTAMRLKRYPPPAGGIALGKMGVGATLMKQLPYDAEVEYLESTGTQWIDTLFKPNPKTTRCEALLAYTTAPNILGLFGARPANTGNALSAYLWGKRADWVGDTSTAISATTGVDYNIICENNTVSFNGTTYSSRVVKSDSYLAFNFYLFNFNNLGTPASQGGQPHRLKRLKLYDNGVLVRDFIPVRKGTTGAMYDRRGIGGMNPDGSARTDGLYFNRGTGNFGYGNDK